MIHSIEYNYRDDNIDVELMLIVNLSVICSCYWHENSAKIV